LYFPNQRTVSGVSFDAEYSPCGQPAQRAFVVASLLPGVTVPRVVPQAVRSVASRITLSVPQNFLAILGFLPKAGVPLLLDSVCTCIISDLKAHEPYDDAGCDDQGRGAEWLHKPRDGERARDDRQPDAIRSEQREVRERVCKH
jgi:hypothetical protein